jgi:hypothetical protein
MSDMQVFANFPIQVPWSVHMRQLDIAYPFWDNGTDSLQYFFTSGGGLPQGNDPPNSWNEQPLYLALLKNAVNTRKDWTAVVRISDLVSVPGASGTTAMNMPFPQIVGVNIKSTPPDLDFWWGTKDFAKYGFGYGFGTLGAAMPVHWINLPQSQFRFGASDYTDAFVHLSDGVVADLLGFPYPDIPDVFFNPDNTGFVPMGVDLTNEWNYAGG